MPNITEAEAIGALFDSTSEYFTFSPRTKSYEQHENTLFKFPLQDPPFTPSDSHKPNYSSSHSNLSQDAATSLQQHSFLDVSPITPFHANDFPNDIVTSSSTLPSNVPSTPSSVHSPFFKSREPLANPTPSSPALYGSISCFDLVGTIGCGSYGKVLLGSISNNTTGIGTLYAIKVLRKRDMHNDGVEEVKRELRALRWIADSVKYVGGTQQSQDQNAGVTFLQKMSESFQNESFVFIILEFHPVSLAYPSVAARLWLRPCSLSSNANDSISKSKSLPISFSSHSLDLKSASGSEDCVVLPFKSLHLVAAELVLGLIFLHQSGIVHQDIKPANIMISSAGHVVIADFGASTALPFSFDYEDFPVIPTARAQKKFHHIVLTPRDLITFTPLYAAPELVCRNRAGLIIYDSRVDWWSFGVVLYELATGSTPFTIPPMTRTKGKGQPSSNEKKSVRKRRSLGDFSLSFGAMEKLAEELQGNNDDHNYDLVLQLQIFIKALLVDHASDRLSGQEVKRHPFFEPISHLWDEIAALEHPPLPGPPEVSLDPDTSLDIASSPRICSPAYDDDYSSASSSRPAEQGGKEGSLSESHPQNSPLSLQITWPVPREGLLADDPIGSPSTCSFSLRDEESDMAHIETVNTQDEGSFSFTNSDSEAQTEEDKENVTEDGLSSHASPLQPFPSTASLHSALAAQEDVNRYPEIDSTEQEFQPAANVKSETDIGYVSDVEEGVDEVEIWNPWIPRPLNGPLYPSESFSSVLPNPYSPQPPLAHRLESTHEFQSLQYMASDSRSKTDLQEISTKSGEILVPAHVSMEAVNIPTGNTSNVLASSKNVDIRDTPPRVPPMRFESDFIGATAVKENQGEDILFFSLNAQSRRGSISISSDKNERERNNKRRSFSRFSISARLSNPKFIERRSINSTVNPTHASIEGHKSNVKQRRQAKKRFSFLASFPGSESKREKGEGERQEQCLARATWNSRRRFSAPLSFPSRGLPSSFDAAKIKLRQKSHSLLNMSRSRSQNALLTEESYSPTLSPVTAVGNGISVLPFPPHELDRMRIEFQNRRATDPIPMPCTPRTRSANGYAHTATLGRSTGSKMMAQAQARATAMRRGQSEQGVRHPSSVAPRVGHIHSRSQSSYNSARSGNWCPSLQDELTMAVLNAMESKSSGSRDFSTMNTIRSGTHRSKSRMAPIRAQSLHQVDRRSDQDRKPALLLTSKPAAPSTRTHRTSWAGMVGLHRTYSRNQDKHFGQGAQRACPTPEGDVEGAALNELKSGDCSAPEGHPEEGKVGSACGDPHNHCSTLQADQYPQRRNDVSRRLSKQRPGSGDVERKVKVENANKRDSLGGRLWKKLRQLASVKITK
ncbi:hypothetical protein J3R30DRAFT_3421265 [Lentinula aciculospora]|uniref:non-specific serine/threonine protein kinase n=1 Tax=Lentinula aciculospora TaxID=153920 RepID=A0A9W9DWZ5_9AGAR|nr:hypothetical protein J3R30DRAFT_3421265 [Lentinula aciculospora]